ncbi:MAG: hypothetical protein HWD59_02235 [Coxiellaceae bacterium]|nr:MAG: hypothetical protein HWD59_02235 [Coxiellaceae bacterium]
MSYNESYELAASATLEDILTTDLALPFRGQQTTIQQFLSEISITENDTVNHRTQTIEEAISEAAALSDLNALLNSSKIFIIKKLALLEQIAEFSTILPQITISIEILNELLIASILEAKPTAFTMVLKLQKY